MNADQWKRRSRRPTDPDRFFRSRDIPAGGAIDIQIPTKACESSPAEIKKLEHVLLTISFIHRRRGDVSILLTSPSGTKNEMLSTRHYDDSKEGLDNWGFMTVHCWGKNLRADGVLAFSYMQLVFRHLQHRGNTLFCRARISIFSQRLLYKTTNSRQFW